MQYVYIVTIALHVMAGVYWAGITIAIARHPEIRVEKTYPTQIGSGTMAVLTGGLLWYFFHGAYFGRTEQVLAIGILSAFAALAVLLFMVGPARQRLADADSDKEEQLRRHMARGEGIAARLLVVTVLCMAVSRMV